MSKHPEGVGIYDLNDLPSIVYTAGNGPLISKFKNNVELAKHLKISRVTVGKYLTSGLIYNKTYRFKVNSK